MFKRIVGSLLILVGVLSTSACAMGVGGALPVGSLKAPVRLPQEAEFHQMISNVMMPDGQTLFVKTWQPKGEIKAVILALHGYGDHAISTFDQAASYWKQQGILTIGYDQRGFGHNPSFGYWPGGQKLVQDMHTMIERVRQSYPDQPLYVMGHSMGGGVILAGAKDLKVDGAILLGPASWGGDLMPVFQRALAWSATAVVPDQRFAGKGIVGIQASDNIPILQGLARDPYYLQPPSPRELLGLVRLMDMAYLGTPALTVPTLFIYGEKDQIALPEVMVQVFDRLPEGQKTKLGYKDGWHMLLRDLQAENVWMDISAWILR